MGKVLAIDYGSKRCGIAESDGSQTIAFGLCTVFSKDLMIFLTDYCKNENVNTIVFGEPKQLSGEVSDIENDIVKVIYRVKKKLPFLHVKREDERFTSKIALQSLHQIGAKKKQKHNKFLIDEMSATLILQSYLDKQHK